MAKLDWLVVRDLVMIESATWWKDGPEIETGELRTEDIGTEVFFLPAAAHTEKAGSFTNTQRLLQWHHQAVEPAGDARSDLWFTYHLGRRIRAKLAGAPPTRRTGRCSTSPGTTRRGPAGRSGRRRGSRRDQRLGRGRATVVVHPAHRRRLHRRAAAGSTAASGPAASTRPPAARRGSSRTGWRPDWGWAWPANRRVLYNRASADPRRQAVE